MSVNKKENERRNMSLSRERESKRRKVHWRNGYWLGVVSGVYYKRTITHEARDEGKIHAVYTGRNKICVWDDT